MSSEFNGIGNLGVIPKLTSVDVLGNGARNVANMRIYFDRQVPDGDNGFKDKGGFWLTVDMWGFRAEEAVRLLNKGSRVFVKGILRQESWNDDKGEERTEMRLTADYFSIDTLCIDSVIYKSKTVPS